MNILYTNIPIVPDVSQCVDSKTINEYFFDITTSYCRLQRPLLKKISPILYYPCSFKVYIHIRVYELIFVSNLILQKDFMK